MLDVAHAVANAAEQTVQDYENLDTHAMSGDMTGGKDGTLLSAIFGRKLPISKAYSSQSQKRVKS
ncbi:MAG: hypothetical protein ABIV47_05120 [Roseiflexaceae bacterium]